jgi:hypothetical protein
MGMALTDSRGNMDNLAVRNLLGERIMEVLGKIATRMPLEQVVKQVGVVCSVCVRYKTKFPDTVEVYSPRSAILLLSLLLLRLIACNGLVVGLKNSRG